MQNILNRQKDRNIQKNNNIRDVSNIKNVYKETIIFWFMTFLTILFFGLAQLTTQKWKNNLVQIDLENQSLTKEDIIQMKEKEQEFEDPLNFGAWEEIPDIIVEKEEWNRQAKVSLLQISGDSNFILPPDTVEDERILKEEDILGCFIDKKTAETLFGNENVIGNKFECQGKSFEVRGIFKDMENCMMIQADTTSFSSFEESLPVGNFTSVNKSGLNKLTLNIAKEKDPDLTAEQFMGRHGLNGTVLTVSWMKDIALIAAFLFPLLLLFQILRKYGCLLKKYKNDPAIFGSLIFFLLLFLTMLLKISNIDVNIPQTIIPTQWSDFSFWNDLWKEQKENFEKIMAASKNKIQFQQEKYFWKTIFYGILSMCCFPFSICKNSNFKIVNSETKHYKVICFAAVLSWIIYFLLILHDPQNGEILTQNYKLWFLLPAYIVCIQGIEYLKLLCSRTQ